MASDPPTLPLQLYQLSSSVSRSISSGIFAATGLDLDQRRLLLSFFGTLIRDFVMAFGVRGGLRLVPKLLKPGAPRDVHSFLEVVFESFGEDSARFGLFVAGFFATYKVSERVIKHWRYRGRGKETPDRCVPLAAGAIASAWLFLMDGDEAFRWTLSKYLAVRAGQCLVNHIVTQLPACYKKAASFGDVAIFGLSCAQLLYGHFVRPESLDPDYIRFLAKITQVDPRWMEANANGLRRGFDDHEHVLDFVLLFSKISGKPAPDPMLQALIATKPLPALPCEALHGGESCPGHIAKIWSGAFREAVPMYFSLHLVPALLFRLKHFINSPAESMLHTVANTLRSSSFMAVCAALYQSLFCAGRFAFARQFLKQDSKLYYWIFGLLSGSLSILIEKKPRRTELALFLLPKALTAVYRVMIDRRWMVNVPRGDFVLFTAAMAVLMSYYRQEPESVSPIVRRILKTFL